MSTLVEQLKEQIGRACLPQPEEELLFHKSRKWRFDLAWPEIQLAIEVDGGTWTGGRHSRGKGYTKDCIKLNEACIGGWACLRVTGDMIRSGMAIKQVTAAIKTQLNKVGA